MPDELAPVVISRPPERVERLLIPAHILFATLQGLALARDREMVAYWLGAAMTPDDAGRSRAIVTTVAFPRAESGYAAFRVEDGQVGLIGEWCAQQGLWILGQVHTHPTDEPHSEADECWPVSHRTGFLSVVIPFFAQLSTLRDPHWRAHELVAGARWNEVDPNERFVVTADVWLP